MWQIDVQAAELIRERRAEAEAYRLAGTRRAGRSGAGGAGGRGVPVRQRLGRALVRAGRRLQQEPRTTRPARPANAAA